MAENRTLTAAGFHVGSAAAGIKPSGALDVGVIVSDTPCAAAAVFTSNRFCGAPVVVGRKHVGKGPLRGVVVNSGCSNVATGKRGIRDAEAMCARLADHIGCEPTQILPASTGVIGRFLPMDKLCAGIDDAVDALADTRKAGQAFARAILTTDTTPKQAFRRVKIRGKEVVVAGCCKGSGMIAPNMATMLAFIGTDARISPSALRGALRKAVDESFNRVTVDECESTSDTVYLLANGSAGNAPIRSTVSSPYRKFATTLAEVCGELAYAIAADGEGATRVIEVVVHGAATAADAHEVARTVAVSPLFRTAVHGGDPNWGRIIQAIGTTRARFQPDRVVVRICGETVFRRGRPVDAADLGTISRAMQAKHVPVLIQLKAGKASDRVLTCDLTKDYIAINADYTT